MEDGKFKDEGNHILAVMRENRVSSGFHTRSNTNQVVQPQKMARVLKFQI